MNALLVRAVIVFERRLLAARMKGAEYVFLPGGHVEHGEYLNEALARELGEELALHYEVGAYLGFAEHRWSDSGTVVHEINHCFSVSVGQTGNPKSKEAHLSFEWIPLGELADRNLQPAALVPLIHRYFAGDQHTWAVSRC